MPIQRIANNLRTESSLITVNNKFMRILCRIGVLLFLPMTFVPADADGIINAATPLVEPVPGVVVNPPDSPFTLSLTGTWEFRLDATNQGIANKWFLAEMPDQIKLPGSTDEQGFGNKTLKAELGRLTREYSYVGSAWYRREVTIPEQWKNKRITLLLERCHWESQVWVDGDPAGMRNSLSVPHVYDLTQWLKPGRHTLTLCIDNRLKINVCHTFGNMNWAHSVTDETQTNWNGVIGRLALEAHDFVGLDSIQVYPDLKQGKLLIKTVAYNQTSEKIEGCLSLVTEPDCGSLGDHPVTLEPGQNKIEVSVLLKDVRLWDEFAPNIYHLKTRLKTVRGDLSFNDQQETTFGLREVGQAEQHLTINGRKVFLRGNLECCIFPLTGYPQMEVDGWKRVIGVAKTYGMNHLRFHSWCPPEAAFLAADESGFYFQVEAPVWDGHGVLGRDATRAAWVLEEVGRILDTYGNHPSFCLMSMGNEWGDGKDYYLRYLVEFSRLKDHRHYYTATAHPALRERNDDYFDAAGTDLGPLRGLGSYENNRPSTQNDFRTSLNGQDRPFIVHEVGQPCQYPDFDQIAKYTGPLKPHNLEVFRQSLDDHHMLDQNKDFVRSTGSLAATIYKENIEAILRTPGLSGFQLLGLQDFPGQGTALIGILDAFWDSKGILTPEQWREFCSPTVPLVRMKNFVWTNNEPFTAQAEVAHYGPADLNQVQPRWVIADTQGRTVAEGTLGKIDIKTGGTTPLGQIGFDWTTIKTPAQLRLKLWLEGTSIANHWNLWVYPADTAEVPANDVQVAEEWNDAVKATLSQGSKVLLLSRQGDLQNAEAAQWNTLLWCYQLFTTQKKTMGILCDPRHPALAGFPTESFGDWQWFDLLEHADAIKLDDMPANYHPIVQFIHDFNFNNKLGAIFELKVGPGRLLVCSIDLTTDLAKRAEARQLRRSLLEYMQGDQFHPAGELDSAKLDGILKKRIKQNASAAPTDTSTAKLHVKAAGNVTALTTTAPWKIEADKVLAQAEGFDYEVAGGTWRDAEGCAWHDPHLVITLRCPRNFEGTLYIHFRDWNRENRNAHLFFDGHDRGLVGRYDGPGVWVKQPVAKADSEDGKLLLDTQTISGPNVMISELMLMPGGDK